MRVAGDLAQGDQGRQQFIHLLRLGAGKASGELFAGERTGCGEECAAQRLDLFGERYGPGEFFLRNGGGFRHLDGFDFALLGLRAAGVLEFRIIVGWCPVAAYTGFAAVIPAPAGIS